MAVRVMLGILGSLGIVASISGAVLWLQAEFAPLDGYRELRTQFVSYVETQRLDTLERRLDDYRRNGTCKREPKVCRELMADIRRLKRKLGVR